MNTSRALSRALYSPAKIVYKDLLNVILNPNQKLHFNNTIANDKCLMNTECFVEAET